jgi:hypothetical protein
MAWGTRRAIVFELALRAGQCRRARRGGEIAALLGLATTALLGATTSAAAAPGADPWYRLRVCESGNNYRINTGNGFYGAYQFTAGTWHAYGGSGLPSNASPAEQDLRARLLYRASGWSPWPACSRRLGLGRDPKYGRTAATVAEPQARRAAPAPARAPAAPAAARPAPAPDRVRPRVPARVGVGHRRFIPAAQRKPARPVVHRPPRLAVWSLPDGGRWGRPVALLHSGAARRAATLHLPVEAFGHLLAWTGDVRPL